MGLFVIFEKSFLLFLSKIEFGPKSTTNDKKWFFGASLGPKDDSYLILDQFRQTKRGKNFFFEKNSCFLQKSAQVWSILPSHPSSIYNIKKKYFILTFFTFFLFCKPNLFGIFVEISSVSRMVSFLA